MANKKLSELSALSAAPVGADIFALTDISTTLTKKVTIAELMESWATVETTHGTASIKDFGTSANELVSLDGSGLLPAVDGSQLTNVSATVATMGSGNSYAAGLVLAGSATHAGSFLRKDGTWVATLALGTSSSTALAGDTTTITGGQATAITANTAKVTFPGFGTAAGTALEGDTALLALGTTSSTALAGDTTIITGGQASAITANTAKDTNVPVATDVIWDAAGDLAVASGADAASKLGIGTAGQVLTVNSGATAPEWSAAAGGGGVSALTLNAQTGTTYTMALTDLGKLVTFSNSSSITITVPAGLGAGFYCYVQQLDVGQVNFLGTKNARNQTCLTGEGALAMLVSEVVDQYVLSGDISNFDGCITLVTDKKNPTNYISFDDSMGNVYMGSDPEWTPSMASGGYGVMTGTVLSGNYKLMQTYDMQTAIDSALSSNSTPTPNAENGGYATANQGSYYDWYVYCGTGNTVTSVSVEDTQSNAFNCVPVLYRMKESALQTIPIWAVTIFFVGSGSSVVESYDSGGSNVVSEYAVGWIDTPVGGKIYFGGHQTGAQVSGVAGGGTPEGHLYLD